MASRNIQTANCALWLKVLGLGTADSNYLFAGLVRTANRKRDVDTKDYAGMPYGKVGSKSVIKGHTLDMELMYKTIRNEALLNCHNPNDYEFDTHVVDSDQAIKVNCAVKLFEIDDSDETGWDGKFSSVPGTAHHFPNCIIDPAITSEYEHGKEFAGKLSIKVNFDDDLEGYSDTKRLTGVDCLETSAGFAVAADGTIL